VSFVGLVDKDFLDARAFRRAVAAGAVAVGLYIFTSWA
jgi:hypothetical protein